MTDATTRPIKYKYYCSFSCKGGFGFVVVDLDGIISTSEDIQVVREGIKENQNLDVLPIIISFQLLDSKT